MADTPQRNPANRRSGDRRTGPRPPGGAAWYVLAFLLLLALAHAFFLKIQGGETISYSQFKEFVRQDKVEEVTLSDEQLRATLKKVAGEPRGKIVSAVRVTDAKLTEDLEAHGVKYTGEIPNRWLSDIVFSWVLMILFLVGIWAFFLRRIGGAEGGVMSFARSKAKIFSEDDVKVSFQDVAGVDEAAQELREIVEFL